MACSGTTSVTVVRDTTDLDQHTIVIHPVVATLHRLVAAIELSASTQVHSATFT